MTTRKGACLFRGSFGCEHTRYYTSRRRANTVQHGLGLHCGGAHIGDRQARSSRRRNRRPIKKRCATRLLPSPRRRAAHTSTGGTRIANSLSECASRVPVGRTGDAGPREAIQPALDTRRDKSPGDPTRGFGDPERGDPLAVSYHCLRTATSNTERGASCEVFPNGWLLHCCYSP